MKEKEKKGTVQKKAENRKKSGTEQTISVNPLQLRACSGKPAWSGNTSGNHTGIPAPLKSHAEAISGYSFDDVKVHYNSHKPAQLKALAFTQGNQVYIGPGQEKHLKHELGHVVQQMQGRVVPNFSINNTPANDSPALEHEADNMF